MEREQARARYRRLRAVLREVAQDHHDNPRVTHRDSTVLLVALWAAVNDKPMCWATVHENWPCSLRPRPQRRRDAKTTTGKSGLPSQSCMSRRLRIDIGC